MRGDIVRPVIDEELYYKVLKLGSENGSGATCFKIALPNLLNQFTETKRRLAEALPDAEKWRFLHLEAEEPLSCQMCQNAHDAVLRKLASAESRLRAASELVKKWRERNLHHCYYCANELEAALRGEAEKP